MSNRDMPPPLKQPEGLPEAAPVEAKEEELHVIGVKPDSTQPKADSVKEIPPEKKGPAAITVVALGSGFFRQSRKNVGDIFVVPSMEKVGDWMRCEDPEKEKIHQQMMAKKKQTAGK